MTMIDKRYMNIRISSCAINILTSLRFLFVLTFVVIASGCSIDPDDGDEGITGTGIILRGTVNETALALNNTVDVKSIDGQRASVNYSANGEYSTNSLPGVGPWLLRVELNQNRSIFGIAYNDGTRNINSFSDISLRRWFAMESMNVDDEFESNGRIQRLPTTTEYDISVTGIFLLIDLVLASYQVEGNDVINTSYRSNDEGIDAFLNRNSVLLEDGLITFQLTDPNTEIQTETATPVDISSNLVESGEPPTTPGSIRAVASDDEIVLAWEPSVDDVAVVGYVVLRDETLLGQTPYPQFIDENVVDGETYRYVIFAVDGSGNSSTPSVPTFGSLNPIVDTIAPPAPTQLSQLSASNTAIRLAWSQPTGSDIASYRVFRSVLDSDSAVIQNVAISRATDTNIRLDETYCYQVSALDGSGNESDLSNMICSSAEGSVPMENIIVDQGDAPSPTNPGIVETVGEWTINDIDALDCSSALTTADISVGRLEISNACFTVPQTLEIDAGETLRLGEGAVLRMGSGADIIVNGGSFTALGTRDNPVILTGLFDTPGSWGGINFRSISTDNTLDGVVIQYGGDGEFQGVIVTGFDGARFRMLNTLVRRNEGLALSLNALGTRIDAFAGNRFQENDDVGNVIATAVSSITANNEFIDNGVNELTIPSREIANEDIVIPNIGIVISWGGIELSGGSITIEPGVVIEMVGASLIDVRGEFNAEGTADAPIAFTSSSQSTGSWDGILLSGNGDKTFDHVSINSGGVSGNTGAIEVDCNQGAAFTFSISNSDISGSDSWGIFAEGSACNYDIDSSVTFSNNALGNFNVP